MIDTHSHILPDLDDGARNLKESVKMARRAVKERVTTLFATPHAMDGVYNCQKDRILYQCDLLTMELARKRIPITLLPGAEIRITHETVTEYDKGNLLTLGDAGTHILLELPPMFIKEAVVRMIRQFTDRGLIPVIAHPERNPVIMGDQAALTEFIYQGAQMQVTASSITGGFGRLAMKTAEQILAMDGEHLLGSDIHPFRKYNMAKAFKRLKKLFGIKKAEEIAFRNLETLVTINKINQLTIGRN